MAIPQLKRTRRTKENNPAPAVAAHGNGAYTIKAPPPWAAGGCSRKGKQFFVPLTDTEEARSIRAHEYAHLAVDALIPDVDTIFEGVSDRWAQVTLDNVVNGFARQHGVSIDALPLTKIPANAKFPDGQEKNHRAQILLQSLSVKSRCTDKTLTPRELGSLKNASDSLQAVGRSIATYPESARHLASGLADIKRITRMLDAMFNIVPPTKDARTDLKALESHIECPKRMSESSGWEDMEIVSAVLNRNVHRSRIAPTRRSGFVGAFRKPLRAILPAFDGQAWETRLRREGGTILLDMSGSMSLTAEQIVLLLRTAPFATIAGYSSECGGGHLQILALNGKYCAAWDNYGGGNGVDGPALSWVAQRKGPKVWISDCQVVGKNSSEHPSLFIECRNLCIKHSIMVFPSIPEYLNAARRAK